MVHCIGNDTPKWAKWGIGFWVNVVPGKFARTLPGRTAHPWEIVQKGHERPKSGGIVANVDCEVLEREKC